MILVLLALLGCRKPEPEAEDALVHPYLAARPDQKEAILARLDREPWATVYAALVETAAETPPEAEGSQWDHSAWSQQADIAQANAMLAWLHDDPEAAARATEILVGVDPDIDTNPTWDLNIRIPDTTIPYANALDLLLGADAISEAEEAEARAILGELNERTYDRYVLDPVYRGLALAPSQNNHPIRTAAAIGHAALLLPEHPDVEHWLDFAASEIGYLLGPDGQYVQEDGGISEGPFYYGFALAAALPFLIGADAALPGDRVLHRECINRQDVEPWAGHGCVDDEAFTFDNPLHDARFRASADWWTAISLPSGLCPPLADSYFNALNGIALLPAFGGGAHLIWRWENGTRPYTMTHGMDLVPHHLAWVEDVEPVEPDWTTIFLPDAGNAVFRSDWSEDAVWGMLVAEAGAARMTLHDHVDGTSFSVAAYGEYLLLDPGYHKPNPLDNAVTSAPQAHNVILIDGQGAPKKGKLTDFGDADAFLERTHDGERVDYAEAWQSYQGHDIVRGMAFVRDRYFVVADRLAYDGLDLPTYAWRLNGYAGNGSGGTFEPGEDGATWERERAGVEVVLASTAPGLVVEELPLVEGEAPWVHQFELDRSVGHHGVIEGTVNGVLPGFLAVIAPYPMDGDRLDVERLDLGEDVAGIRVTHPDGAVDVAILRDPEATERIALPDGRTVETDARLVLLDADGLFVLMADGTEVRVDGEVRASGEGGVVAE